MPSVEAFLSALRKLLACVRLEGDNAMHHYPLTEKAPNRWWNRRYDHACVIGREWLRRANRGTIPADLGEHQ